MVRCREGEMRELRISRIEGHKDRRTWGSGNRGDWNLKKVGRGRGYRDGIISKVGDS